MKVSKIPVSEWKKMFFKFKTSNIFSQDKCNDELGGKGRKEFHNLLKERKQLYFFRLAKYCHLSGSSSLFPALVLGPAQD